jgi:glycosyltransferase involved in cell wall biosynthesis
MRVAFVAPFGLRHKTTVWARTLPLAQGLRAHGYEAGIFIPPWDSPEDGGSRSVAESEAGSVALTQVRTDGGLPATAGRLLRAVRDYDPAIVHIVKPRAHAGVVQWLLWQMAHAGRPGPLLLLDADDWEQAWAAVNDYTPPVARFLAWQEEWGLRHADGFTVASRWLEERVAFLSPETPRLYLPNGVTLPAGPAELAGAPAQPTVLFFTRYAEVTPTWLAAFVEALRVVQPTARLVVAGAPLRGGAEQEFREVIDAQRKRALATRNPPVDVLFLGTVPPQSLPGLYAASTVAIFPAHPEPLQEAKCSVRLATTLLNGVPVVASAVGEQSHFGAEGAALLLPPHAGPADFAASVSTLLDSSEERGAMVARARAHLAAHYQWRDLSARLAAFYDRLQVERGRAHSTP